MAEFTPVDSGLRGVALVEAINESFDALRTVEASADLPAAPRPGMLVADLLTGYMKQRNQANDAWVTLWPIDSAPLAVVPVLLTVADFAGSPATYEIDGTHETHLIVDATGATEDLIVALPEIETAHRKRIFVVRIDTGTTYKVKVKAPGGVSIAGFGVGTLDLTKCFDQIVLVNFGTEFGAIDSYWFVDGPLFRQVSSAASGTYSGLPYDDLILVDTTSGNRIVELPPANGYAGREVVVKRTTGGGNTCTVQPQVAEAIDSIAPGTGFTLASQNDRARLKSDGVQWWRVD